MLVDTMNSSMMNLYLSVMLILDLLPSYFALPMDDTMMVDKDNPNRFVLDLKNKM